MSQFLGCVKSAWLDWQSKVELANTLVTFIREFKFNINPSYEERIREAQGAASPVPFIPRVIFQLNNFL